jgi:hypothetical protein
VLQQIDVTGLVRKRKLQSTRCVSSDGLPIVVCFLQIRPLTAFAPMFSQMVTKDTVDADIFDMQERKSKMNAAIMESGAEAKKERKDMLKKSMERFLGSPKAKSVSRGMDKENGKDVICVI